MHSATEDTAKDNPQICCGAEQDAEDGSEDGAGASDIQELDEINLPCIHRQIIDTILTRVAGSLTKRIGSEYLIDECSIEDITQNEEQ
jgi:hypothetical protein